ncbi:MAG: hypothetical protein BMS9Abin02_2076 [Anaerolineae bacterium]|nr:MAG: hypothetical protein BMS9Abin02_2076 [Anaerolineae bacterium]
MGQAEQQILQMLSDGIISAEEAGNLLEALKSQGTDPIIIDANAPPGETLEGEIITPLSTQPPPELSRYRRFWLIPFLIAIGSILLSGLGLFLLYQSVNPAYLGFICLWAIFLGALFSAAVLVLAQRSTWLYLNVEERNGVKIRVAFPLPLSLVKWAVRVARPFVPTEQFMHLQMAASLVDMMQRSPDREPIAIDVDDGNGDRVQIYIG